MFILMNFQQSVQSSDKAPVADAIPAKVSLGQSVRRTTNGRETDRPVSLYVGKGGYQQEFNDASITHRYKRKGNSQVYNNHRGISLLAIAGKITSKNPVESLEYSS